MERPQFRLSKARAVPDSDMRKLIATFLSLLLMGFPALALAVPTFADTPDITGHHILSGSTSTSFSYTPPAGTNQVLIVMITSSGGVTYTATQNGVSLTIVDNSVVGQCDGTGAAGEEQYGYVINPTAGTFVLNRSTSAAGTDFGVFTVNSADLTGNPVDVANCHTKNGGGSNMVSATVPLANDLLIDWATSGNFLYTGHGALQTEYISYDDTVNIQGIFASYINGSSTVNKVQGMSELYSGAPNVDIQLIAIKAAAAVNSFQLWSYSTF